MSLLPSHKQAATTVDIDSLLQDSYLLAVELSQGGIAQNSLELSKLCTRQIENVRQHLKDADLSLRNIDYISYAQCALLDETVLRCAKGKTHADWAGEPLQAKFFSRHQAGDFLYEDMREVLREPAPDLHVLTVYQRVLMLGFQGRYRDADDPERLQLLAALDARVEPLRLSKSLPTQLDFGSRTNGWRWVRSPMFHAVTVGILLVGCWLGLDHLLGGLIATLLPGQA